MKRLIFKVKYSFDAEDKKIEGVEDEGSWYLVDQRGNFYSHGPMRPITLVDMARLRATLTPLIKIRDEYLTVDEIERRLSEVDVQK